MSEIVEIYVKEQRQVEDSLQDVNDTEANTGRYEDAEKEEIIVEPEVSGLLAVTHEEDDPIWEERSSQHAWDAKNTTYVQRDSGTQPELSLTLFSPEQMEAAAAIASSILQTQGKLVQQRHRKQQEQHKCEICQKVFSRINNLRNHQQTHKKQYCHICHKDLLTRKKLTNHIRRFHSEEPCTCNICNKEFKESYELKRHMRIHTGERPYLCDMCEKSFSNAGALKEHRQTHSDEKRFTCDLCQKQFKQKYSLKTHLLAHTQKPYACNMCNKEFVRPSDLTEHMLSHSAMKPYACNKCKTQFSRKDTFYRHAKRKFCMNISDEKAFLVRNEDCSWS